MIGGGVIINVSSMEPLCLSQPSFERIKMRAIFRSRLPLGKFGDPNEVAKVISFLAGDLPAI